MTQESTHVATPVSRYYHAFGSKLHTRIPFVHKFPEKNDASYFFEVEEAEAEEAEAEGEEYFVGPPGSRKAKTPLHPAVQVPTTFVMCANDTHCLDPTQGEPAVLLVYRATRKFQIQSPVPPHIQESNSLIRLVFLFYHHKTVSQPTHHSRPIFSPLYCLRLRLRLRWWWW